MDDIAILRKFLSGMYSFEESDLDAFCAVWQPYACKRKTVLTHAGQPERYLYFVLEGLQRSFYIGEENEEATIVFTYPPSFSGLIDSFLTQTPASCSLETLTASRFLRTSYSQVKELMNTYPALMEFVLNATAMALKGVLDRQIEMQCFTAEQRFRSLLKRSPHVLQLIPHKYLASYLGIDATRFSKILNSVRI